MDIYKQVDLFECPLCGGPSLLEEESNWCFYVSCMDCGCRTAEVAYNNPSGRIEAAQQAGHLWNIGKVLPSEPGE